MTTRSSGGPFAIQPGLPPHRGDDRFLQGELMAFESLLTYSRFFGDTATSARERTHGSRAIAFSGGIGEAYAESTFRHFLGIERVRADRSERQVLLLLVTLRRCPQRGVRFSPWLASSTLDALGLCVREVDFVGWYHHERIAGAVLAQGYEAPDAEAPARIADRVVRVMRERLPKAAAERLRVRVVRLGARAR